MNREIEYVLEVAKTGSILKASEKLYVTSSAISKYIQTLEGRLNVKLFDRIGKKFQLTYAGERYIYWARQEEKLQKEMMIELSDIANSIQGIVRVGIPTGLSEFWIKNSLLKFRQKYPQIKVELHEDISSNITQLLLSNELDFAITEVTDNDSSLLYKNLYEETISIVASQNNLTLKNRAIHKDGHKYPWISISDCADIDFTMPYSNQNINKTLKKSFAANDIRIKSNLQARTIISILTCVKLDMGVTITTDYVVHLTNNQHMLDTYSFGDVPLTRQWAIAYNKSHYLSEHVKTLIDMTECDYNDLNRLIENKQLDPL